ncbi:FAD/NAD(P)-binding domain-containing protein [Annulohypoxylon truncatum]|uniref:FAD/NAD(P)-binding domain-containing protein n=1 Tax=Annulohypoxylon truncatum TaxID=327061 RepID=UPI0020071F67|nr:FAD/NAD(P)-binding domain-containing protein [Annulohypoxylon truncatum]KAI1212089.1 FAD/NAD(P)-binding domain-containing protein [Annulohypoxylon truncatum]
MSSSPTIRVAIIGGGLVGAAVLRGLLRYPHIAVDLYESRPAFRDEGPGLTLNTKMQAMLAAIDPELERCLDRAGAVLTTPVIRMAAGPHSGRQIEVNGHGPRCKKNVSRQAFLTEMLNGVPPQMIHLGARITSVTDSACGHGLLMTFADGTHLTYDIVIGADGIHGFTRRLIFGADESLIKPRPTGFWSLPVKVPLLRAQHAMGAQHLDPMNPIQGGFIGDGWSMIYNLLDNGSEVEIVVCGKTEERGGEEDGQSGAQWATLFTPDEFQELFASNQIPVVQGMVDLIQSVYTVQVAAICQLEHRPAPTYVTKNTCLIGDTAYSMPPFQSASIGIAIEEALILTTLLARLPSRAGIPAALQAYDQVCRPRAERAARSSAETGTLVTGRAAGVGLNADVLQIQMRSKFDFLLEGDSDTHRATASLIMDHLLAAGESAE